MTNNDDPGSSTQTLPAIGPELALLIEMKREMHAGFRETNANIDLLSGDLTTVKAEVRAIQTWKGEQEARANSNSMRARQPSQFDMEAAAQLADERVARETLSAKVDALDGKQDVQLELLNTLVKLTEKPVVKLVFTAIGTAVLGYLTARGLR